MHTETKSTFAVVLIIALGAALLSGCKQSKPPDWAALWTVISATVIEPQVEASQAQVEAKLKLDGFFDPATGEVHFNLRDIERFGRHLIDACLQTATDLRIETKATARAAKTLQAPLAPEVPSAAQ